MNYPLNIMGIDPGPTQSTFVRCVFTGETNLLGTPLVIAGVGSIGNHEMLEKLVGLFNVHVVCEMVACYGMAVGKEVFETVRWIGRFEQRHAERGGKMEMVYRMAVKMNLCQSARAKDGNIRQALIDRFGEVGSKSKPGPLYGISGHAWSALAIAVTYYDSLVANEKESARNTKQVGRPDHRPGHAHASEAAGGNY